MLAGKGLNNRRGGALDAPQNALPNPALDAGGPSAADGEAGGPADAAGAAGMGAAPFANGAAGGAAGGVRAPDISKLDPQEIADRLFNRIMKLNGEGKTDSVQFFAPMALQAYQMVSDRLGQPLNADQRYDMGRIAEVAGAIPLAKAQADTILQQHPGHLLGLVLAMHVAQKSGNTPAMQEYARQFARVRTAQLATGLPEYTRHKADIDAVTAP